jgi:Protein of unknown function (DUF3891)
VLHRADADGLLVIAQPAHAWVAGQLARAWGNARFGPVEPWEEVCLGAEQHDVGHAAWEAAPTLNPATGRPYSFLELPLEEHLRLWSTAGRLALAQGRYAALLVSGHGTGLYERRDLAAMAPDQAAAVRSFLERERAFQEGLVTSLRQERRYAEHASEAALARNRRLVAVWDAVSLALCHGLRERRVVGPVPTADGEVALALTPAPGAADRVAVWPWPFGRERVELVFDARRLPETFASEEAMRAALAGAPWVGLRAVLSPGD